MTIESSTQSSVATAVAPEQQWQKDAELVADVLARRQDADIRLARRFDAIAGPLVRKLMREPDAQMDLYQDGFETVLTRVRSGALREPARLAGYISRTVRYKFYETLRARDRFPTPLENIEPLMDEHAPSPQCSLERQQMRDAVIEGIAALKVARDRALLTRLYLCEEDKQAVCDALELTPRHFDRVSFRGRSRLADAVREQHPEFAR
ncbi:MAG: sigma-70 family RNA polymerase sigma factor [Pseudomonadota bacterium]